MTKLPRRIIGLDPGPANFGWCVIDVKGPRTFSVAKNGMLDVQHTISAVTVPSDELKQQVRAYRTRMHKLVTRSQATDLAMERYIPRTRGLANETVNYMIGNTLSLLTETSIQVQVFMAVTWKARVKKIMDLEAFYKMVNVPDHICDATFQALYLAEKMYGFDLSLFVAERRLKQLAKQIDTTTTYVRPPPKPRGRKR